MWWITAPELGAATPVGAPLVCWGWWVLHRGWGTSPAPSAHTPEEMKVLELKRVAGRGVLNNAAAHCP